MSVLLGAGLGTLGGLFGIGGGLIAIPVLGVLFGLDQQLAQGTALVMVVPNVALALWRYNQRNRLQWRHALVLAGSGLLAASLGALLAVGLDARLMRLAFAGFLLILLMHQLWRLLERQPEKIPREAPGKGALTGLGLFSGAMGGLFGVGGAVIVTPVLTSVFGVSQVIAQGLSLALALPSTAVTLATYAWHQQVDWPMAIPLALGGLFSISWGVRLAHALPERLLRALFCSFLLLCALLLVLEAG